MLTVGTFALVAIGTTLIAAGLVLIGSGARSRKGLASAESDALSRSSLLNQERVDRINRSRETSGGRLIDRVRVAFFGVWLIVLGAIVIANALW